MRYPRDLKTKKFYSITCLLVCISSFCICKHAQLYGNNVRTCLISISITLALSSVVWSIQRFKLIEKFKNDIY